MTLLAAPAATLILPPCCRFACIAELCCPPPALHPQPNNSPPPSSSRPRPRPRPRRTQLDKIERCSLRPSSSHSACDPTTDVAFLTLKQPAPLRASLPPPRVRL
ncbi:uncharacterized protein NECHADRAFT_103043, partial [Fusarium vanettenii 77-13-4]